MLSLASFGAGSGSYIPKLAGTATKLGVGEQRTHGFRVTSLPVVYDMTLIVLYSANGMVTG